MPAIVCLFAGVARSYVMYKSYALGTPIICVNILRYYRHTSCIGPRDSLVRLVLALARPHAQTWS